MEPTTITDILWATLAAFAGFEVALAVNYLLLKSLLRAIQLGLRRSSRPDLG